VKFVVSFVLLDRLWHRSNRSEQNQKSLMKHLMNKQLIFSKAILASLVRNLKFHLNRKKVILPELKFLEEAQHSFVEDSDGLVVCEGCDRFVADHDS